MSAERYAEVAALLVRSGIDVNQPVAPEVIDRVARIVASATRGKRGVSDAAA